MKKILFYIAGMLTMVWGIAHLIPTAGVVEGFGDISLDNKHIITMEWMVEGFSLLFIGLITMVVTRTDAGSKLAKNMYLSIVGMLFAMAVLSLFTGFRVAFLPFKLCPVIFTVSALLIVFGMVSGTSKPAHSH